MSQQTIRTTIVGGTGYTGAELVRLALGHPALEVVSVVGNSTAERPISEVLPSLRGILDGKVEPFDPDAIAQLADVAFCALPHAASAEAVGALRARGVVVFDLSADFRFEDLAQYERLYGTHPVPSLLSEAVYGLVELHREALRTADLIAVPGCYPTASTLALAPLLHNALVSPEGIVVDAKSGVSGAGRGLSAGTHFPEVSEGLRAYKAGQHRHGPEIEKELSRLAGTPLRLTFVPHLVPMTRGILATCYADPATPEVSPERCTEAARALYEDSPSVQVLEPGEHPDTLWVRGSNRLFLSYTQDPGSGKVIALSAIDNLVKGAAGQALQCLNVRFGLPEGTGVVGASRLAVTRILHVSDLHLEDGFPGVGWQSFLNKRLVGLANLWLRRRRLFADAPLKVRALAEFVRAEAVDFIVCTGDFTALGTEPELAYARQVIEPLATAGAGFFVVPGNHDLYLQDAVEGGWFERHFGEFLKCELPEEAVDGCWPQVWLPAEGLAVVGVNSARPNPSPSSSSGAIPEAQLEALRAVLADPRVKERFVILATHYAPRLGNGLPDNPHHGLENADAFLAAASPLTRGVIVHGHVHRRYHVRVSESSVPLCCAGSTTHEGREGLWVYDVDQAQARATPGGWDGSGYVLEPESAIVLDA